MKLKKLLTTFLFTLSTSASFANIGYVKYQIINNTPNDYYVTLRQQFMNPLETCQGMIAANSTKECDGKLNLGHTVFYIHAIRELAKENRSEFETSINNTQNALITWTLDLNKEERLNISYKFKPL
ncbi:MAG: hypothetical protein CK424_01735 [Legionella sp.]|nr:MAG: hypothetical protein CK424_01735 [Legionella sp.]